jgi:hypothetical protein
MLVHIVTIFFFFFLLVPFLQVGYSWIDSLKLHAGKKVSDLEFENAKFRFPYNTPATKEAYYFRSVFETHFPHNSARESVPGGPSVACSTPAAILWDASFKNFADQSGRSVAGVHAAAYDDKTRESTKGAQVKEEVLADLKKSDGAVAPAQSPNPAQPAEATSSSGK